MSDQPDLFTDNPYSDRSADALTKMPCTLPALPVTEVPLTVCAEHPFTMTGRAIDKDGEPRDYQVIDRVNIHRPAPNA